MDKVKVENFIKDATRNNLRIMGVTAGRISCEKVTIKRNATIKNRIDFGGFAITSDHCTWVEGSWYKEFDYPCHLSVSTNTSI